MTAWLGIVLSRETGYIAAIWLSNAILAYTLIRMSPRQWAPPLLAAALAFLAANMVTGSGPALAMSLALCNLLEAVVCAALMHRFAPAPDLSRPRDLLVFCAIALGPAPIASGLAGSAALALLAGAPFLDILSIWYPADALGLLIVTPLLLSIRRSDVTGLLSRERMVHSVALLGFSLVVAAVVFSQNRFPLLFLVSLPIVFTTFRLGMAGAALSLVGIGGVALAATMHEMGPLTLIDGSHQENVLVLQLFLATAALTGFPVASVLAEQRRLNDALVAAREQSRLSEAAHEEMSRRLQATLDNMDQGLFMADGQGRILVHNRRALEVLDLPSDLLAEAPTVTDVLAFQEARGDFDSLPASAHKQLRPHRDGDRIRIYERAGPNDTTIEVRTVGLGDGGVVRTYSDVTAQRDAERLLAKREAQFRLLAEYSSDIISRASLDGIYRYVSPAAELVLGFAPESLVASPVGGEVHPDDETSLAEALGKVALGRVEMTQCTYRSRHSDGRWVWVETSFRVVRAPGTDVPAELIACTRDVSERQAQAEELQAAHDEARRNAVDAEAANSAKSDFLARMSHELRTPLNAVIGFGQILQMNKKGNLNDGEVQYVEHIIKGGHHLLNLVNELLDLAGIESGKLKLSIEPVVAQAAVRQAADTMRPIAMRSQVRIEVANFDAALTIRADVQRLRQVLLNLLSNAIKYNRPDGFVRISASRPDDSKVRIVVEDGGCGISTVHQSQIFEPFNRLGAEYTAVEGNGIGLSLCKRLVEAMDGQIGFESKAGTGSTFWIDLPAETAVLPSNIGAITADLPVNTGVAGYKILYVEDNPANLRLMETLVATIPGATLLSAPSGSLGLEMAGHELPEVIVLDLHLPGLNGFEVLKRLKTDPATWSIPVIALTASAMPREVTRGMEAGFFRYLTKPLDVKLFLEALDDAISASREAPDEDAVHRERSTGYS